MTSPLQIQQDNRLIGPVMYIAGLGRSGSTMLEAIMGSRDDVAALGEVVHLWERGIVRNELCGCGEHFADCPFWVAVGQEAFGGWGRLDLDRVATLKQAVDRHRRVPKTLSPVKTAASQRLIRLYNDLYLRVYDAAASVSGARLVIDSSKHGSLVAALSNSDQLDLRVLHLVRDAVAVAYSWSKETHRPEAQSAEDELMVQYSGTLSSAYWGMTNLEVEALRLGKAKPVRLRYEDLVADPERALTETLTALGLASFMPTIAGGIQLRTQHTVAGNPMRFRRGALHLRRDDAWRTAMAPHDRRVVKSLTGAMRMFYGYTS